MTSGRLAQQPKNNEHLGAKIALSSPPASGILLNFATFFAALAAIFKAIEISIQVAQFSSKPSKKDPQEPTLLGNISSALGFTSAICLTGAFVGFAAVADRATQNEKNGSELLPSPIALNPTTGDQVTTKGQVI